MRVMVFRDRPDCLLVHAPEGSDMALPPLSPPFTVESVRTACRAAGVEVRVTEAIKAGRWTDSINKLRGAERAERASKSRLAESVAHAAAAASAETPLFAHRKHLIEQKTAVDDELRSLRAELGEARSIAHLHGVFMDPADFRKKNARVAYLSNESLSIQNVLTELKDRIKEQNRQRSQDSRERFIRLAQERMSRELWDELWEAVRDEAAE